MKKLKYLCFGLILMLLSQVFHAQVPPDPPGQHGTNTDQGAGGNASLAPGVLLLIGLGAAYGAKRYHDLVKKMSD